MGDPLARHTPGIRSSATLSRYVVLELLRPTLFALLAFGIVVLLADLFSYTNLIVNRGVEFQDVARLVMLQLVPTLTTTMPLATLIGVLVGLGRLSADRELVAFETTGLSHWQTALPCFGFAATVALVAVVMSTIASPASQRSVRNQLIQIAEEAPNLALTPGTTARIGDWRIEASRVEAQQGRLSKLMLFIPSLRETIFAKRGTIASDPEAGPVLRLDDGLILMNGKTRASAIRFENLETRLPRVDPKRAVPIDEIRTQPLGQLIERSSESHPTSERRPSQIEIHRRIAHGMAALPLGLLAVGLSLGWGRSSRSKGIVLGLFGVASYYALNQLSEGLLRDKEASIGIALWMPNTIVLIVAAVLLWRSGKDAPDPSPLSVIWRNRARARVHSKRWALPRYVGLQFLGLSLLCVLGLTFAYTAVDIADNLKWFNKYDATAAEIGRFYAARLPVLAARVIPLSLLLGCSLTISILGSNGELLGMRACGLSVFRSVTPVWVLCILAVPLDYLVASEFVPRGNARASHVNQTEIKNGSTHSASEPGRMWYRTKGRIVEMERRDLRREYARAVTIYDLDGEGLPKQRLDADTARTIRPGVWLLEAPSRVAYEADQLSRDESTALLIEIDGTLATEVDTSELTPGQLRTMISRLDRRGINSTAYRTDLHTKFSAPFACFLLPLLVLCFSSTGPPFPRPTLALMACVAIAVLHAVVSSFATSMGHSGQLPPAIAGWSPAIFFTVAGLTMGFRLRAGMQR